MSSTVAPDRFASATWWPLAITLITLPGLGLAAAAGAAPTTPAVAIGLLAFAAAALTALGLGILGAARPGWMHGSFAVIVVCVGITGVSIFYQYEPQRLPSGDYPGGDFMMSAGVGLVLLACVAAMGRQRALLGAVPRILPILSAVPGLAYAFASDTFAAFQGWEDTGAAALVFAATIRGVPLFHLALALNLVIRPRRRRHPHVTAWLATTVAMALWGTFIGGFLFIASLGEGSNATAADTAVTAVIMTGGLACWTVLAAWLWLARSHHRKPGVPALP